MVARTRDTRDVSPQGARALAVILECLIAIDEQRQRIEELERQCLTRS